MSKYDYAERINEYVNEHEAVVARLDQAEAAIARVRELCDLTERTALDAMPQLEGKVVVYTSLVRRALDGGAE